MKIEFKSLKLKNFLSFGNKETEYKFQDGKIINLKGRNLDTDAGKENGSSNGSGKSAIIQSLVYAVYGNGLSDIKQDEFINITNGKDMKVVLELTIGEKKATITRTRKPNSVTFVVDGEDLTRDSIANTNKLIQEMIGVEYETFILSFVMTTSVKPLLSRKPAEQRNFMEDLLGMNTLTERAERVKKIKSDAEVEYRLVGRDIDNANQWNEHERERVNTAKKKSEEFEQQRNERLSELKSKIDSMSEILESQKDIRKDLETLAGAERDTKVAEQSFRSIENRVRKLETKKAELERELGAVSGSRETIKSKIVDAETELSSERKSLDEASEHLDDITPSIGVIEQAEEIDRKLIEIEKRLEEFEKCVKEAEEERTTVENEISHLKSGVCPHCTQQWTPKDKAARLGDLEASVVDLNQEIEDIRGEESTYKKTHSELMSELEHLDVQVIENSEDIIADYQKTSNAIDRGQKDIDRIINNIDKLEQQLKDVDDKDRIKAIEDDLTACKSDLDEATADMDMSEKALEDADKAFEEASSQVNTYGFENTSELDVYLAKADSVVEKYEELKHSSNPYDGGEEPSLQDVNVLIAKRDSWDNEIKHCKYLVKLLTDSKSFIRRNIIGRYIPYLNKQINMYADKLDSPHVCEIKNDLTVSIEYMRKSVSYHNLSAGERLKLDISTSIALRDLMAMLGTKSGLLIVDEVFDSALDTQSKRNVFKLMRERFDTVLLVSHSGEFDDKCDNTVTVTKQNGFSWLD